MVEKHEKDSSTKRNIKFKIEKEETKDNSKR